MGAPSAGATRESCAECHGMTRQRIRYWRAMSDTAWSTCFADLEVATPAAAQAVIDCVRGGTSDGEYASSHMGVFSSAARLPWFQYVFESALGAAGAAELDDFITTAGMPPEMAVPLTQAEFDLVAEWFIRGAPMAESVLPDDPAPTECTPGISADVGTHVAAMATGGWAARNLESSLLMYGCSGGGGPSTCLSSYPLASTTAFGATWDEFDGSVLRVLYTTSYASAYWTRSSADGRFVAHGASTGGAGARFIDLMRDVAIPGDARYDPSFFPDNSGFVFHGARAIVCEQSVLSVGAPMALTFTESGCQTNRTIGLYEHVGASLSGGDYWSVHGQFVSDNGGQSRTTSDPEAAFSSDSRTRLTLMANDGSGFTVTATASVSTPFEGDAIISPSSQLILTRVAGPDDRQLGFVVRRLDVTRMGTTLSVAAPEIARYCVTGGKPAFSFDERYITYHSYEADGRANVYILELATGEVTQITNMGTNQYALFPHFRSDGWIYFVVRTGEAEAEHVVASDAAIVLSSR